MSDDGRITAKKARRSVLGVLFLVVLLGAVYLTIAVFQQEFTDTDEVTVDTPRAGLLMDDNSYVKMRGVKVGRVTDVRLIAGDRVRLTLGIYPEDLDRVPRNIRVNLIPPTVFGAKYVELVPPEHPEGRLLAGSSIRADHVNVEINTAFAHLVDLLDATEPTKVSRALNALATALRGNGNDAGELIELANSYLKQLNPNLGLLRSDVVKGTKVADNLTRDTVPGLIKIGVNGGKVSDTLLSSKATLAAVLSDLQSFSGNTKKFVDRQRPNLRRTLQVTEPTFRTLARYSSGFPCLFKGLVALNKGVQPVIGGTTPAINLFVLLTYAEKGYKNPKDLPVVAADNGPYCGTLPNVPTNYIPPTPNLDVGYNGHAKYKPGSGPDPAADGPAQITGIISGLLQTAGAAGGTP